MSVICGTLTTKIGKQVNKISAGGRLFFPKGVYHKMHNDAEEVTILRSEKDVDFVPIEFAYSLAQLYPLMSPNGGLTFKMLLKICVLDDLFDSIPYDPPPAFFIVMKKIIKPYARLFGVKLYDIKSKPK